MDQFPDEQHVWLRNRVHGTYLHADSDGRGVSLSRSQMSMKAAWVVHVYGDAQHVLLQSAAYGRYLSATNVLAPLTCRGYHVALRTYDDDDDVAIRWQPVRVGLGDAIWLRRVAEGGLLGYLRANGRYLLWNNVVSVDYLYTMSTLTEWVVQPIPSRECVPRLPSPPRQWLNPSVLMPSRVVMGNGEGCNANKVSFPFRGRSVFLLRKELIRRLGFSPNVSDNLVMYVRAGRYGRLTPLVVNLPRNTQTLVILITAEAPANGRPRYPDFVQRREDPEQVS
uniref:Uncharacterized protein n=1 Tax=Avena sativa TaxID=4498 RepID=A0ACD5TG80_AVESA